MTDVDTIRRRIEALHGNALMRRATQSPPAERDEVIDEAYLAGVVYGLQRAVRSFDEDLVAETPADVIEAYRTVSQSYQHAQRVNSVDEDDRGGAFQ